MRVLVFGAGVLGSLYGARLHEAGNDVSVLARGERLSSIRTQGVVLEDARTHRRTTTSVPVVERLDSSDAYELCIVLVRKTQVAEVLPILSANHPIPSFLFMTSGAAGPEALIDAVGRKRVLRGFAGAGGTLVGDVVRYSVVPRLQPTTLGELDGRRTPRLRRIAGALDVAGFRVALCSDMDAWMKTHEAWIGPLAHAIYAAGGDTRHLARTPLALKLMVRAIGENFSVLHRLGIPIVPIRLRALEFVPERVLSVLLRRVIDTKLIQNIAVGHAMAARDEMALIDAEFQALRRRSRLDTPAADMRTFLDSTAGPMPLGARTSACGRV